MGPIVEAALIGSICGFAIGRDDPIVLLALAIPPFVAGVHLGGMRAVAQALAAEIAAVVIAALLWEREITDDQAFDVFTLVGDRTRPRPDRRLPARQPAVRAATRWCPTWTRSG